MWHKTRATKRISWLEWKIVKNIKWGSSKILLWHITSVITDEMTKNKKAEKFLQQLVKKIIWQRIGDIKYMANIIKQDR